MKKICCLLIGFVMIFSFSACSCNCGNVENVNIKTVESKIYSQEDIDDAIQTILTEFKNWNGCTLTEIYYVGDEDMKDQVYTDIYGGDEAIVLLSSFDVDSSGGDGSLNRNSTYDNWMWILVRDKGGNWKHVDHGY
ncbi:MAG: hypothetical protein K2K01_07210 [Eubacterium sp.]|nr:hypothetical protein [Eubacterium sp.]